MEYFAAGMGVGDGNTNLSIDGMSEGYGGLNSVINNALQTMLNGDIFHVSKNDVHIFSNIECNCQIISC